MCIYIWKKEKQDLHPNPWSNRAFESACGDLACAKDSVTRVSDPSNQTTNLFSSFDCLSNEQWFSRGKHKETVEILFMSCKQLTLCALASLDESGYHVGSNIKLQKLMRHETTHLDKLSHWGGNVWSHYHDKWIRLPNVDYAALELVMGSLGFEGIEPKTIHLNMPWMRVQKGRLNKVRAVHWVPRRLSDFDPFCPWTSFGRFQESQGCDNPPWKQKFASPWQVTGDWGTERSVHPSAVDLAISHGPPFQVLCSGV